MRFSRQCGLGLVLAGLMTLAASSAAGAAASGFRIVRSPTLPSGGSLLGVAALSPTDAWAVGSTGTNMLVESYDGARWRVRRPPRDGGKPAVLNAISAAPDGSIWIAGTQTRLAGTRGLVYKQVGAHWLRMRIPAGVVELTAVHAFSSSDVWAGGMTKTRRALIHYDGAHWTIVDDSGAGVRRRGGAITGIAGTSVQPFATGQGVSSAGQTGWLEGRRATGWWEPIGASGPVVSVNGISSSSASDVWAVGARASAGRPLTPLVFHYNGVSASMKAPRHAYTTDHVLNAVADLARTSVWAVGYRVSSDGTHDQTLIDFWNGKAWQTPGNPNAASGDSWLAAVTGVPGSATEVWAVGAGAGQPLILHHS